MFRVSLTAPAQISPHKPPNFCEVLLEYARLCDESCRDLSRWCEAAAMIVSRIFESELTRCSVTGGLRAGAAPARGRLERPENVPPRKRWRRSVRGGARVCQLQSGRGARPGDRVNLRELS